MTSVQFGGVDLSPYVRDVSAETALATPPQDEVLAHLLFLPHPVTFTGRVALTPAGYRALFCRTHPRVRRMHAAYGRRRR